MNKVIRIISLVLATLSMSMPLSFAQGHPSSNKDGWQKKMMVERIGFITAEVGLTSDEAEVFWPIYNKYQDERMDSFRKTMDSYKALEKAVDEYRPAKELNSLLQQYIDCGKATYEIDTKYLPMFRNILSAEKVAKVYMAEEKFRRNQIQKLGSFGPRPHQERK